MNELTFYEQRLLSIVRRVTRDTGKPAPTNLIIDEVGHPRSTVMYWLRKLEDEGRIKRLTSRTGWLIPNGLIEKRIERAKRDEDNIARWMRRELGFTNTLTALTAAGLAA